MKRKLLSLLLAAGMVLGLASCGAPAKQSEGSGAGGGAQAESSAQAGGESSGGAEASAKTWDSVYELDFYYPVYFYMPSKEGIAAVEAELNKITSEKVGVTVKLHPIDYFQFSDQINLALSGGEKVDLFMPLTGLTTYVSKGQITPITQYTAELKETMDLMGEEFLRASYIGKELYAIPRYGANTMVWYYVYRKDIADEVGFDKSTVKNVKDLEELLTKVHEKHPELYPLVPTNAGDQMLVRSSDSGELGFRVDYLGDNADGCTGCIIDDGATVENFYATDAFKTITKLAYDWNQKGLLMPGTSTSPDIATDLISSGKGFSTLIGYGYPGSDEQFSSGNYGTWPMTFTTVGEDIMESACFNVEWSVGYTSKDPAAACRFLNLLYTDVDVLNLIIYGIKDVDYTLNGDPTLMTSIGYPEGLDATTVPYTARITCGLMGNQFIMYGFGGEIEKFGMDLIQNAYRSSALGFLFDSASVKNQVTAVTNVIQKYYKGLVCGEMDPETTIPKFVADLEAAGINDIIAEKQKQLDAWRAEQK